MSVAADQALLLALGAVGRALRDFGKPAMIIGGLAVVARGVPRVTIDIDATVSGEGLDLDALFATLARHEIGPRIADAVEFARRNQVLLLRHLTTGVPVDVSVAWLPFENEALARAEKVDFGGVSVPVATAEDLVVLKAVAWRERDRSDIERLLAIHLETIDLDRVRRLVVEFAAALEDPERPAQLDAIVERVRRAPRPR